MIAATAFRVGRAVLAGLGNLYDAVIPPKVMETSAAKVSADRLTEVSAASPVPSVRRLGHLDEADVVLLLLRALEGHVTDERTTTLVVDHFWRGLLAKRCQ